MRSLYIFDTTKKSICNIASIVLMAFIFTTATAGQSYLSEIRVKWANSAEYLQAMAETLPDTLYGFQPTEEEMTFGEQLVHIANNMIRLSRNQLGYGKENPPVTPDQDVSPEVIRKYLKRAFRYAANAIAHESDESLNTETEFFAGPKTHRQIINLMNDHVTHHRGQLIVYLRLNEIAPPGYVGW